MTYNSLWLESLAGCSLTSHNPLFSFCFPHLPALSQRAGVLFACGMNEVPELLFGICKALRNKVDRLVCLVLVWLHRRGLGIKFSHLWLVRERVLDSRQERGSRRISWQGGKLAILHFTQESMRWNTPRALHTKRAVQHRTPSSHHSVYTSHTPQ